MKDYLSFELEKSGEKSLGDFQIVLKEKREREKQLCFKSGGLRSDFRRYDFA